MTSIHEENYFEDFYENFYDETPDNFDEPTEKDFYDRTPDDFYEEKDTEPSETGISVIGDSIYDTSDEDYFDPEIERINEEVNNAG